KFLERSREGVVGVPDEHRRLVLSSVRVNIVPMAKAVCVVEAHDRSPFFGMVDLQLDRVLENAFATTLVGTPHSRLLRHRLKNPFAMDHARLGHADARWLSIRLTAFGSFF